MSQKAEQGLEVYLVGGAVRDQRLGLPVADRDWVVVGATAEDMHRRGFKQVGRDFPVFLHPQSHEEYALARTERKTAPGYHGFVLHAAPDVTLEQDLQRRDLTINAMAQTPAGTLIDPFGGAQDLRDGMLRHVSPAFAEDPVRILRVARFAARLAPLGFRVAHATGDLMKRMVADGEVDALVAERVWAELEGALGERRPSECFRVLRACGALGRLMPEIDALYGVPQPAAHHPEVDTGVHALLALDAATALTDDVRVRFATLVHDLGKAATPEDQWPSHHAHERRGLDPIRALCERFRVPHETRELALLVARYHSHCHRAAELQPATLLKTLEALDGFRRPRRVEPFLLACTADARGRAGHENDPYPQADIFRRALAAAAGVDTSAITARKLEGPQTGEAIRQARIAAIARLS